MSVLLETLSGLKRKLQITVPAEEVSKSYQQRLQKEGANAKIKGFRPGKVPLNVVERYYGKHIRAQLIEGLIDESFRKAVEKEDLRLAGQPNLETLPEWEKGSDLAFSIEFEVYPVVGKVKTDGVQASEYEVTVNDSDLDGMLSDLKKQHIEWSAIERAAQAGDKVIIDFTGSINDVPFDGGSAEDFTVVIGDKRMIPGFEDGLLGIEAGISRELKLMFPDEYHAKDLAGQAVEFQVTAKGIEEPVEPALDDEFAKKVGFDTVDQLKEKASENMQNEAMARLNDKHKQAFLDQLLDKHDFDLPEVLLDGELDYLRALSKQQGVEAGEPEGEAEGESEADKQEMMVQARKRVKLGVLLSEIVRQYDIKLDQSAVQKKVFELVRHYPNPNELIEWLYKDKARLAEIETSVLEDQAVEALLKDMDKETVVMDYAKVADFVQEEAES